MWLLYVAHQEKASRLLVAQLFHVCGSLFFSQPIMYRIWDREPSETTFYHAAKTS
jgi:hypothetical protein